jgi:GNAT superfamily N-acetyltransferase
MTDAPAQITIRRLAPQDVARVAEFERDIATISFPDDPVTDLGFYEKKLRAAIEDRKSEPLVATIGGDIIGWAWIAERENFTTRERYADLRSFYVAEAHRGAGPAFALMRTCLAYCRSRGFVRIVGRTAATNDAMKALYHLYGFTAKHVVYERDTSEGSHPSNRSSMADPERVSGLSERAQTRGFRKPGNREP